MSLTNPLTRTADKAGVIGAIVTAMGCAACFPALASLGAAIGLGFLSQYESVFIHYLLPLFAVIALLANVIGGLRHRQWLRMVLGMVGPVLVLAAALLMSSMGLPTAWLLYPGLVLMVGVSIWDLVSPPGKGHGGANPDPTCC
ncbi:MULTISPECIES: organomercurial transporter MerC [Rhodanobacter]|nr:MULTISPECIES: organomercurial transporter MerC [Rhodanobacter]KZC18714.1 mercury transporter MerC [Rhodanobacter denitrificans]KZC30824.1 mercury transporter MerC [Rhodanobacter sp. FW510-R10]UJM95505.1 organomercurial transporter MerC [Rhodanobacter denitrificans]UJM99036.1 organomercurial transporter MerC [Rhodanobacter denitrificans]UJN21549.1 organomercurial transporter MerC [Rhodanobacter denitrificans]